MVFAVCTNHVQSSSLHNRALVNILKLVHRLLILNWLDLVSKKVGQLLCYFNSFFLPTRIAGIAEVGKHLDGTTGWTSLWSPLGSCPSNQQKGRKAKHQPQRSMPAAQVFWYAYIFLDSSYLPRGWVPVPLTLGNLLVIVDITTYVSFTAEEQLFTPLHLQ